jgi:hypothetical protein
MSTPLEQLRDFRTKIAAGYTPTDEETKEAIKLLREHRTQAISKSPKMAGAAAAAKLPTDLNDLFK